MEIIRTDKSVISRWWWSVDRLVLMALFVLMGIGIFLVTSASPSVAERIGLNSFYFTNRQLLFMLPTILVMIGMSFVKRKNLWRICSLVTILSILCMIGLTVVGFHTKGATRWFSLFGFSLQPSEFVKPAFAVASAWLFTRQQYETKFPGRTIVFGVFTVIIGLLLLQPDVGMSFVVCCIWGAQR